MPTLASKHARSPSLPTAYSPAGASVSTRRSRQVVWVAVVACLATLGLLSYGLTPLSLSSQVPETWSPAPLVAELKPEPAPPPVVQYDAEDSSTWPAPTPGLPFNATLEERLREWSRMPISTAQRWAVWSSDALPHRISYHSKLWGFIAPQDEARSRSRHLR